AAKPSLSLSMNANFFSWEQNKNIHDLPCLRAIGLAISEFNIISSPGEGINEPKTGKKVLPDSILFYDSKPPGIVREPGREYEPPKEARTAVSGILIVDNGNDVSNTTRVQDANISSTSNAPRTAIGLNEDGSSLYFVIAIGDALPGYDGVTLPGLAKFFMD